MLCEYLVSVLSVLYTVFVLIFYCISFSLSAITPCHVLIRVKLSCMLVKDMQTVAECKKKNEAEISTLVFPLENPSNYIKTSTTVAPRVLHSQS